MHLKHYTLPTSLNFFYFLFKFFNVESKCPHRHFAVKITLIIVTSFSFIFSYDLIMFNSLFPRKYRYYIDLGNFLFSKRHGEIRFKITETIVYELFI